MPIHPKPLSPQGVIVARAEAQPVLSHILDLLLRGGAACYLEFEHKLLQACETAYATHRFSGQDGRQHYEKKTYTRSNPEDVKAVLASCGVLLSTEQYKSIRVAYSDPVGFILSDPFLSALCPLGQVPTALARMLLSTLPDPIAAETNLALPPKPTALTSPTSPQHSSEGDDASTEALVELPELFLESVLRAMANVFGSSPDEEKSDRSSAEATFKRAAYEEALRCFSSSVYPDQRVPGISFANFIAAELLLLYANPVVTDAAFTSIVVSLEQRLSTCASELQAAPPLTREQKRDASTTKAATTTTATGAGSSVHRSRNPPMPSAAAVAAATVNKDPTCSMADFAMTHHNVPRRPRKFEYYMQHDDRRDEWLRGRQEKDAQGMYMRHTVGYGGHLPEYQYHFGRTFHVIEEDLPNLTRPRSPQEPLAPDAFGQGTVLRRNQMTDHHYTLS